MVFWEAYVSDESMGTFAPIVVYWLYAGFYQLLPPLDKYRLHTRKEEDEKNLVPLGSVIKGVLLQQLVQAVVAELLFRLTSNMNSSGIIVQPSIFIQIVQIIIAMLVMDTWQYFVHRYMHQNLFLYRHIHSQHHRLVVPFQIQPVPLEMASKVISLQTIDMSPYLREGDEKGRKKVVEEIWKASTECGFFQAVNHGIPVELLKKTRRIYREFFDRPDEEKFKCVPQVGERPSPGYFKSQQFGTKEGHEDFLTVAPGRLNVYPKDFPEFKQVLEEIFPYLVKLAAAIEEIINSASGLPPNFLKEYNDDRNSDFLLGLHYPAAENLSNIGRYPHEDVNLITFVYQDHVGGLQVLNNGQWIPVIPDDEKLVVNIGDILQVLSNNRLKSATHRVYRTEGTERDSFAFFYSLKPDKWVEPLPQFTTEVGEPPKYRGFLYDDYMQLRRRDYTDNQPDKYEDIARITYYAINT